LPGRVVRLHLNPVQKQELRDLDGQIALGVLRHLLGARASLELGAPLRFPLTEPVIRTIARQLGHHVGIKRARTMRRRLRAAHVIEDAGSYRQPYRNTGGATGYKVMLYRLGDRVRGAVVRGEVRLAATPKPPVGTGGLVKRLRRVGWWEHSLFGTFDGLPPPEFTRRQRRRMRANGEVKQV
jgi:hypothetical protein